MESNIEALKKSWEKCSPMITNKETKLKDINFNDLIAAFFCPGPFYYYIFDFYKRDFTYLHPNVEEMIGLKPGQQDLEHFMKRLHPEDIHHMSKCEEAAFQFVFNKVPKEKRKFYKVSFCYRMMDPQGNYRMYLHQVISLSLNEEGAMEHSFGVDTDISHLTTKNNYKISFIGYNGEPSYYNLDPGELVSEYTPTKSLFSAREVEVIKLMAEGFTAAETAEKLSLSAETVKTHIKNILSRSECKNTPQLIVKCIKEGLI